MPTASWRDRIAVERLLDDDQAMANILAAVNAQPWPTECDLSPTQLRVIGAASHGLENGEIATVLGMSIESVKTHLKRAYPRLAAKNRTHAVAIALRRSLIV